MQPYLEAVRNATDEASAKAATEDLANYVNEIGGDVQNALAPFFESIDPTPQLTQLTALADIKFSAQDMVVKQAETNGILAQINSNLGAANYADGIPAFAAGGWVNGPTRILAGEQGRELVVPNHVSEFLSRVGIPINSSGGGNDALLSELVAEVRALREENARLSQRLEVAINASGNRLVGSIEKQTNEANRRQREAAAAQPRGSR